MKPIVDARPFLDIGLLSLLLVDQVLTVNGVAAVRNQDAARSYG